MCMFSCTIWGSVRISDRPGISDHCCVAGAVQRQMLLFHSTQAMNSQVEPQSFALSNWECKLSCTQIQTTAKHRGESKITRGKLKELRTGQWGTLAEPSHVFKLKVYLGTSFSRQLSWLILSFLKEKICSLPRFPWNHVPRLKEEITAVCNCITVQWLFVYAYVFYFNFLGIAGAQSNPW